MYFLDAEKNKKLKEGRVWEPWFKINSYKGVYKYSIISAVYNVEKYINDFILSCENQTYVPFEIILVDDGSVDGTAAKIKELSRQFNNIKYVYKSNGGQSSARNIGLTIATGDYVTFIDPDDFVDSRYFESVDQCINKTRADLVNCKIVVYREKNKRFTNNHFLKKMFLAGERTFYSNEIPDDVIINNVARTIYKLNIIRERNLSFNEKIREFEDGQFATEFIESGLCKIALCPAAKYYNRRRSDESSTMQNSWCGRAAFTDVFEFGYLDVLNKNVKNNKLDRHIQKLLFAQLVWHIIRFMNNPAPIGILTEKEFDKYRKDIVSIFKYIDKDTIEHYEYNNLRYQDKVAILEYFKGINHTCNNAYIENVSKNGDVVIAFIAGRIDNRNCSIKINGKPVEAKVLKEQRFDIFNEEMYRKIFILIKTDKTGKCTIRVNGRRTKIRILDNWSFDEFSIDSLFGDSQIKTTSKSSCFFDVITRKFENCWLISDRIDAANDNGERFYKYLISSHKEINAYFVISKKSNDWDRLKKEGFRLIDYGSIFHRLARQRCKNFISSQCDSRQLNIFKDYKDKRNWKFIFLQHGVIKDDMSKWLNGYDIDLFVTSTYPEWFSIVSCSTYKFTEREVVLTGLPRFDSLLTNDLKRKTNRTIVFMPTWRKYLVGGLNDKSDRRVVDKGFLSSDFYKYWNNLIQNSEIRKLCINNNIKIIFWPHINMIDAIEYFNFPDFVTVKTGTNCDIQDILKEADIFVTDYSSTAFDAALLRKCILYYQFDKDKQFSGDHTYRPGYFNYERDGFGPVVESTEDVVSHINKYINNNFSPSLLYLKRIDKTFKYCDTNNCNRVFAEILKLN